MNQSNDEMKDLERLNMLLDGESADPDADRKWVESDVTLARRYQEYQRMHVLAKSLETPAPSPGFVDRVLSGAARPRSVLTPRYRYAFAAGVLALLGCFSLYLIFTNTDEMPQETVTASLAPSIEGDTIMDADMAFMSSIEESTEFMDMSQSLASLEELPEEELLSLVAEMASDEEVFAESMNGEGTVSPIPDTNEEAGKTQSFVALFDFVETLDATEADALNQALHAALKEA